MNTPRLTAGLEKSLEIDEPIISFSPKLGETPIALSPSNEGEETPVSAYYPIQQDSQWSKWNKVDANTPQAVMVHQALHLHQQIEKKLTELTTSSNAEVRNFLEQAQEALTAYHQSNPNSEIARLYFQKANSLYQAAETHHTYPQKSEILLGIASASHYLAENFEKELGSTDIINSGYRALSNFQQALSLLEKPSLGVAPAEQSKKSKQVSYLSLAGNVALAALKEQLRPASEFNEFNQKAGSYFVTAATYYEKASEGLASDNITNALYHFEAGSAYEEAAKEILHERPESQKIHDFFFESAMSFTGAAVTLASNPTKAKNLAAIGKNYFSLAKEYQKAEPNLEVIKSLEEQLKNVPQEIQGVGEVVKKALK